MDIPEYVSPINACQINVHPIRSFSNTKPEVPAFDVFTFCMAQAGRWTHLPAVVCLCCERVLPGRTLINRVSKATQDNHGKTGSRSVVSGLKSHRLQTKPWISLSRIPVICYNRCPWMSPGLSTRSMTPSVRPCARRQIRWWCWPVPEIGRASCRERV